MRACKECRSLTDAPGPICPGCEQGRAICAEPDPVPEAGPPIEIVGNPSMPLHTMDDISAWWGTR